jgi:hypothetical protein
MVLAALVNACVRRPPVLVPPPGGVDAVEGFASASIAGADASVKGKFAFVFRRPGLGRVEAVDPIGRTVFLLHFRDDRAWFVLPSKKVYAEAEAEVMMRRILGVSLRPDDALALLSGVWPADGGVGGWTVGRDAEGRVAGGERGEFGFTVREFFRGDGAPREIALYGGGASGRVKVLKLAFDPPPRDGAFDVTFVGRYAAKTWDEILDIIDR